MKSEDGNSFEDEVYVLRGRIVDAANQRVASGSPGLRADWTVWQLRLKVLAIVISVILVLWWIALMRSCFAEMEHQKLDRLRDQAAQIRDSIDVALLARDIDRAISLWYDSSVLDPADRAAIELRLEAVAPLEYDNDYAILTTSSWQLYGPDLHRARVRIDVDIDDRFITTELDRVDFYLGKSADFARRKVILRAEDLDRLSGVNEVFRSSGRFRMWGRLRTDGMMWYGIILEEVHRYEAIQ